jgi:hypothetical protein
VDLGLQERAICCVVTGWRPLGRSDRYYCLRREKPALVLTRLTLAVAAVACRESSGLGLGDALAAHWAGFAAVVVDG